MLIRRNKNQRFYLINKKELIFFPVLKKNISLQTEIRIVIILKIKNYDKS